MDDGVRETETNRLKYIKNLSIATEYENISSQIKTAVDTIPPNDATIFTPSIDTPLTVTENVKFDEKKFDDFVFFDDDDEKERRSVKFSSSSVQAKNPNHPIEILGRTSESKKRSSVADVSLRSSETKRKSITDVHRRKSDIGKDIKQFIEKKHVFNILSDNSSGSLNTNCKNSVLLKNLSRKKKKKEEEKINPNNNNDLELFNDLKIHGKSKNSVESVFETDDYENEKLRFDFLNGDKNYEEDENEEEIENFDKINSLEAKKQQKSATEQEEEEDDNENQFFNFDRYCEIDDQNYENEDNFFENNSSNSLQKVSRSKKSLNHLNRDLGGSTQICAPPLSVAQQLGFADNQEYYEYLMLAQRHASTNFINSTDIIYSENAVRMKFIGPFLLGDMIGKGSFGKVKEGLCSQTLQRVAVKIINKKRVKKTPNGVENVLREIKLLNNLKHKNIVQLIDVYCKVDEETRGNTGIFNWFSSIEDEPISWKQDDGTEFECNVQVLKWYLVFEYCPCTLQNILEDEGSIDVTRNRDIKPGNILVTTDGIIKLSDFGIAEQFDRYNGSEMESTEFAGTHQFLPPEIVNGELKYYMLTGKFPFEFTKDGSILGLYELIIKCEYEIPDFLDSSCQSLIRGMLTKDEKKRFNLEQIKSHPWTLSSQNPEKQTPISLYPEQVNPVIQQQEISNQIDNNSDSKDKDLNNEDAEEEVAKNFDSCNFETTMIPYIEALYSAELEEDLKKNLTLEQLVMQLYPLEGINK
ncbi:Serine/threonine-protein kinase STK11 [Clydaea vesicula]|uniref:non-specific serine/threonine protein kinase n=1 Tax=Clydaea vesicula TaxID=447962 RepID=A0AAD5U0R6_9FUNG|nr:Serine/threonine-protein kinase STK11 [Clydaea vesicula]